MKDTDEAPPSAENEERYRKEQYARSLERDIRGTKHAIEEMQYSQVDEETKQLQMFELKNRLKEQVAHYMDYCRINRITPTNYRLQIGTRKK